MEKKINLDKFFQMSKLKPKDLNIDQVLDMIKVIQEVDVEGYDLYRKPWITTQLREDVVERNSQDFKNFKQKEEGFFKVKKVLNKGE